MRESLAALTAFASLRPARLLMVLENERLTLTAAESLCHAAEHLSLEQPTRSSEHRRERHAEAVHVVAASHFLAGAAP
jgi:hypothetical protein